MMVDFSKHFILVKNFLSTIKGKTLLIAHYDADGITSALIFSRILEKYNLNYGEDFFLSIARDSYRNEYNNNETINETLKKYDNIILLDYCFDNYDKLSSKNIFVFDHHLSGEQNKDYIINPAWQVNPNELPAASAIVYNLYYYLFGEDKLLKKIAFIGAASDFMIYASLPYLYTNEKDDELFMSNSILIKPIIFDIFQNLQCIYEKEGEEDKLFEHLLTNTKKDLSGFFYFNNEHVNRILDIERKELEYTKEILDSAIIDEQKKLIIINLPKDKKEIKKYVLNILEFMYSNYTKVICIERKTMFSCSLRSSNVKLLEFINKLKQELPGFNGGGHDFAAGCAGPLDKKDFILEQLRNKL
jgi:single-stranded DNA-specific DHH superfamily exonuclease